MSAQTSSEPIEITDLIALWDIINHKGRKVKLYSLTRSGLDKVKNSADKRDVENIDKKFNALINILQPVIITELKRKILGFFSSSKRYYPTDAQRAIQAFDGFHWLFNQAFDELKREGKLIDATRGRYQINVNKV